ncbi:MAG: hypothetical protein DHS20C12_11700 [Pseudohongiella sp.]|nr:MAG: hypothetical protein DHS20C12_11700 [Pseudohongiella sp.]
MFLQILPYATGAFGLTLFLSLLLISRSQHVQPEIEPRRYTNGHYNEYWANVYQTNKPLQSIAFEAFIQEPEKHLQEMMDWDSNYADNDSLRPLLPAQEAAALGIELGDSYDIDAEAVLEFTQAGRRYLNARTASQLDGKTRYQF